MPGYKIFIFLKKILLDIVYILFKILSLFLKRGPSGFIIKDGMRIVILSFFRIGDNLFLSPVYREIKRKFGDVKISVLLNNRGAAQVLENNPNIDEVIYLNDYFAGVKYVLNNFNKKTDIVIDYSANFYWSLIFRFLPAKFRLARQNGQKVGHFMVCDFGKLHDREVKYKKGYIVDYYLNIAESLGFEREDGRMEIFIDKDEEIRAMENYDFLKKKFFVFHLGAYNRENLWPKWKYLTDVVLKKYKDIYIVLTGTNSDRKMADEIIKHVDGSGQYRIISLVGETRIRDLVVILSKATLYVGGDTGVTHIAITLGRKVVMLFGRADYNLYCPTGENIIPIYSDATCYPCYTYSNVYNRCPYDRSLCSGLISMTEVFEKIKYLLK